MARTQARPAPTQRVGLGPLQLTCRACGSRMRMGHHSHRTVTTLQGVNWSTSEQDISLILNALEQCASEQDNRHSS